MLDRFILNGVDVDLKLYPQNVRFCLMSADFGPSHSIDIEDVIFKACRFEVNPVVLTANNKALENHTAKYPMIKTFLKTAIIPAGQTNFVWDNLFQTQCPTKLCVGFVSTESLTGVCCVSVIHVLVGCLCVVFVYLHIFPPIIVFVFGFILHRSFFCFLLQETSPKILITSRRLTPRVLDYT